MKKLYFEGEKRKINTQKCLLMCTVLEWHFSLHESSSSFFLAYVTFWFLIGFFFLEDFSLSTNISESIAPVHWLFSFFWYVFLSCVHKCISCNLLCVLAYKTSAVVPISLYWGTFFYFYLKLLWFASFLELILNEVFHTFGSIWQSPEASDSHSRLLSLL